MRTQITARRIVALAILVVAFPSMALISTGAAAQETTPTPEMTPTPILEPTPTAEGYYAQSSAIESSTGPVLGRGINPDGFTSEFYDLDNLIDPAFTTPYTSPIDFHIECFDEPYPWNGCKLDSDPTDDKELVDGREWSVRWTGTLVVPVDGEYTFTLDDVDDGARLLIDNVEIVDTGWYWPGQDKYPSPQTAELMAGSHDITIEYEQRIYWIASLRVVWSGPGFTDEVIPLATLMAEVRVLTEDGAQPMPWDGLVNDTLEVEAVLYEDPHPDTITAQVTAEQSGKVSTITLAYEETLPDGGHVYRGSQAADQLVNRPDELTVAAVVNAHIDAEYGIAQTFMGDLVGMDESFKRGIAWGEGDEETSRPPASLEYFKAGGYENAKVEIIGHNALADEFFIENQADVLLYIGEGWHDNNYLYLLNRIEEDEEVINEGETARPQDIETSWQSVQVPVFFGCSVLDINNLNNWEMDYSSPGLKWVEEVPGPQTWLGFQFSAPQIVDQKGYEILYAMADEVVNQGEEWVDAWKHATSGKLTTNRAPGGVAINLVEDDGVYHYWYEWFCLGDFGCVYSWRGYDRSDWKSSSSGLEVLMASPAEVHIFDYEGRHTGPIVGGEYATEIPGSDFWKTDLFGELADEGSGQADRISIRTADLSQLDSIILIGTDIGTFDFIFTIPDRLAGTQYKVAFIDVPVSPGEIYFLNPDPDTGFVLESPFGGQVTPTEVSVISLDLPVNLTIQGVTSGHGMYQSDVIATLSASTKSSLPPIAGFEYDLGAGWQTYQDSLTFTTNGEHILRYRGIFEDGRYDVIQETIFMIYKTNNQPIADAGPDQTAPEGSTVTLSAAASIDPDNDPITFVWEVYNSIGPEVVLSSTTDIAPTFFAPDDGVYTFRVTVTDSKGAANEDETLVTVSNSAPFVEDITAPFVPVLIDTMITASAEFNDAGIIDDHSATWNWGDGSTSPGIVVEGDGQGVVTGEHTYSESGIYTIQLTVTDKDGAFGTSVFLFSVVYDPEGEFVTGGGWIDSPAGAYALDPSFVSKANFGFNAKYKNGATIPSGQIQFGLQEADFNFHGTEYEWLVFSGDQAQYQGTGTVNGESGYGFLVSVIDGDVDGGNGLDRFRVKIWDLLSGEIVYDSQMDDPDSAAPTVLLGGGSIVFH